MSSEVLHTLLLVNEQEVENLTGFLTQDSAYAVKIAVNDTETTASVGATEWRYQLAIIDDLLISLNGGALRQASLDLIRKIKTHHPETEIIFLTNQHGEHAQTALDAGAFRYLLKPINGDELMRSLRQAAEYRQLKCEKRIFESLLKTSAALSSERNQREVLQVILRGMQDAGFDRVRLYLLSEDRVRLVGIAQVGIKEERFVGVEWPVADDMHMKKLIADPRPQVFSYAMGKPTNPEDRLDKEGLEEWLSVPLMLRGKVIGQMSADNKYSRRPIINRNLAPLALFADQAAAAIENARLFEETQQWADQLETVRRTALAITSTSALTRGTLLETIARQAVKLLRAKSGGIYKYFPEREELELIADHQRPEYLGRTLKKGEGMAGQLVESGAPFVVVDDYNKWGNQALIYAGKREFGAVIEVPLRWQEETVGVLYLDDEVGRKFTEDDARLLGLFAQQAAIALANKEMIDRDEERLAQLEKLSQATTEIMGNLGVMSLPDLLTLIARHATGILDAEVCTVLMVKREGILSLEASYGHREGGFPRGREFPIRTGPNVGLTSHIAHERKLFNAHGKKLTEHFAVRGGTPAHTPSGECHSLLAIPLKQREMHGEKLVGLLRADNKKGQDGLSHPALKFTKEDEWILAIFAEAIVAAIESAQRAEELGRQRKEKDRLVASLPLATISVDRQGTVIAFNQQSEEIFDFVADEVLGTNVNWLYYDQEEPRRIGKLLRAEGGKLNNYETRIRNKAGQAVPIRLAATWLLDEEGKRIGSAGYFEDLTALKEAQDRFALIMKAGNIVAQAQDLSQGLQSLAEMLSALFPNALCRILLSDDSDDDSGSILVTKAAYSLLYSDDNRLKWSVVIGQRIRVTDYQGLDQILEAGVPKLIRYSDARVQANLERLSRYLGLERPIQSLLMVPLRLEERVLGMLSLGELQREQDSQFKPENVKLAAAIAAQSAVLIHRISSLEETWRREELLKALAQASEGMRATQAIHQLLPKIVRLATQLVNCQAGGLWVNLRYLGQLELRAAYNLDNTLLGSKLPHYVGLVGAVACTGKVEIRQNYSDGPGRQDLLAHCGLQTAIAFPLKQAAGEVEAVLLVGDGNPDRRFTRADRDILERFAAQASLALQTAQFVEREQLRLGRLAILNRISNYIQEAKDREKSLHAVLTGVTADYGLRFNRASLLLVDEFGEFLNGEMGIGQFTLEDAQAAWRADDVKNFDDYLMRSQSEGIVLTPIGESVRRLRLPLNSDATGIFAEAMRRSDYTLVEPHQFDRLPAGFREKFQPATPLVIAPLIVKEQAIGMLVADNKFNWVPITDEDAKLLMTFANTAALTLDNLKLLQQTRSDAERLQAFHQVSYDLSTLQDPAKLPQAIVEETLKAAGATWVSLLLIDELGRTQNPITVGKNKYVHEIRPNGISMQVMREGKAIALPDIEKESGRVNRRMRQNNIRAAVCLPLLLPKKHLGVIWVHYDQPHRFTDFEVASLQLYVNHAAIAYETAQQIQTLECVHRAADALAGAETTDEVLKQILQSAHEVLHADAVVLWAYDAEWGKFIPHRSVASGIEDHIWNKHHPRIRHDGTGTAYKLMQKGLVFISDTEDSVRNHELGPHTRDLLRDCHARGFQGIALEVGEEKLGVLYGLYHQPLSFSEEGKEAALTFAAHAALALKKARLLKRLEKTTQAAEAVAKVTVFGDHQETLDSIAAEIKEATGCDSVVLFECDRHKNQLLHPPTMTGVKHLEEASNSEKQRGYSLVYKILRMDKPYPVENVAEDPDFKDKQFALSEEVVSCIALPLEASGQKVGVLFVNYCRPHPFSPNDLRTVQLLANQTAVALGYAQFLEEHARQLREQQALVQISKQMLGTVNLHKVMDLAVKRAAQLLGTEFSNIVLPDQAGNLIFSAVFGWKQEMVGQTTMKPGRGSQAGYTTKIKQPVRVEDYHTEKRFKVPQIVFDHGIKSGMSVPMFRDDEIVGAMIVHTHATRHFSEEEVILLQLLANQTAMAVRSAQRYEELERANKELEQTRGLVIARTALAWVSINSLAWGHNIGIHAATIKDYVDHLYGDLKARAPVAKLKGRLENIEEMTQIIQKALLAAPLPDEEAVESVPICDLIGERIDQLRTHERLSTLNGEPPVECQFNEHQMNNPTVRASSEWLKRAFDLLVDNAIEAMAKSKKKILTVDLQLAGDNVEISISDTGKGIPPEIQPKLLRQPIYKPKGEKGSGIGLLLAQVIAQAYGGDVRIGSTGITGTTMIISLPLEDNGTRGR